MYKALTEDEGAFGSRMSIVVGVGVLGVETRMERVETYKNVEVGVDVEAVVVD